MVALSTIDRTKLPRHIAIIMDGNGRWAQRQMKPRLFGHRAGAKNVQDIVEVCRELGVKHLTLYAFSSENWRRPETEVSGLMTILKNYLKSELPKMLKNDIRLMAIGDHSLLPDSVRSILYSTMESTASNSKMTLNLALSYGSRNEIVRAVQRISERCVLGELQPENITEEDLAVYLDTHRLPDPDLLIRTGGESRLSNFLLWQVSYSEIYFTDVMWPDFKRDVFLKALADYQNRERRFGKTGEQLQSE